MPPHPRTRRRPPRWRQLRHRRLRLPPLRLRQLRRKAPESRQHHLLGLGKGDLPALAPERGVEIGILHPRQAQKTALEIEILPGQPVVALGDLHQALHHRGVGLVGQMGGGHQVGVTAQLALLGVVEQQVVEAGGEHQGVVGVLLQKGGEGPLAHLGVRVVEEGQKLFPGHLPGRLLVRQAEGEVHLPPALAIGSDCHAHRLHSSGDGARFWSSHSNSSAERIKTRRRMRITPGSCRRSSIA